jgi:IS30 family transposase
LHDGALRTPYRHLTLDERRAIFRLLNAQVPMEEIANQLGRHRSTIHHEISRNLFRDVKEYRGYFPITADDSARRRRQRQRKLICDARLRQHVTNMLARWWSPEPIAGRLKHAGEDVRVCHETIYQFVYSPEGRALALHRHLLRARRLRRRRFGRKPRSPKIPLPRTIGQRPIEIDRRREIGHWEADLLIFKRAHGQANVTSLVERQSQLVRLVSNRNRRSGHVIKALGDALAALPPPARRTITFDRGSEFFGYEDLAKNHGIDAYFCDPHSPWQKGSVENTNGRLRRYLPGELDLALITPIHLQEIETRMNSTPRKCLGFQTPQEAFAAAARPAYRTSPGTRPEKANCPKYLRSSSGPSGLGAGVSTAASASSARPATARVRGQG